MMLSILQMNNKILIPRKHIIEQQRYPITFATPVRPCVSVLSNGITSDLVFSHLTILVSVAYIRRK